MNRKLRAAIVGFGGIAHAHAPAYKDNSGIELVALADPVASQMEEASSEINIGSHSIDGLDKLHKYASLTELLQNEKLDFVDICAPTPVHSELAVQALEAGVNVICEKPMARTLAQTDAMIAAARRSGKLLMTAQCLRFSPSYTELKRIINSREFGKLLRLTLRRTSGLPTGYGNWFRDGKKSGGALLDMHIHDTDLVNWILGIPKAVRTIGITHYTGAIDDSHTTYIYDDGKMVCAETSWSMDGFACPLAAVFENASVTMADTNVLSIIRQDQKTEERTVANDDCYTMEIHAFAEAVRQGKCVIENCTPESTRDTLRIALAEEHSVLTGQLVELQDYC